MSKDDLLALLALEDAGSFTAAAELLGTVQSTVSRRIASLEAWAGCRLIDRSPGMRGALTPAGAALARRAPAALQAWADCESPPQHGPGSPGGRAR